MREIKFRAWHLIDGRWAMESEIENSVLVNTFYHGGRFQLDERAKHGLANDLGTTMELMQYTGLKDKNGKEIYEGDIIRESEDCWGIVVFDENAAFTVLMHNVGPNEPLSDFTHDSRIIGNVHEHPHLLAVME